MTTKSSKIPRLKKIEDSTFAMGKATESNFNKTGSLLSLRASLACYRATMQAIRDQVRYQIIGEAR